jgi:dTDP-L-rhamnose 4-epimerase
VRAISLALSERLAGFDVVNIGSGLATTVQDITASLRRLLKSESVFNVSGDFRSGDIRHCYADLSWARNRMGFEPSVPLEEGLSRFVDWVLTQAIVEDRSTQALRELGRLGLGRMAT